MFAVVSFRVRFSLKSIRGQHLLREISQLLLVFSKGQSTGAVTMPRLTLKDILRRDDKGHCLGKNL